MKAVWGTLCFKIWLKVSFLDLCLPQFLIIKKVERKLVSEIVVGPNWRLFDLERRMRPRKDLYWERCAEV